MIAGTSGTLAEVIGEMVAPDPKWQKQARTRLDSLTKPLGSLGRLRSEEHTSELQSR